MKTKRWMVLSLLCCSTLAFGCGDVSDEELTEESSDDSDPVEVAAPAPDPCANPDGDGLATTSGFDMSTREAALEAYARLRVACNLDVQLNRRGKAVTIEIPIK